MILIGNLADSLTSKQWQSLARMSAHFLDVLQGLTTLKLFGRAKEQVQVIAQVSDRFRDTTLGYWAWRSFGARARDGGDAQHGHCGRRDRPASAVRSPGFRAGFLCSRPGPRFYLPLRLLGTRFHASVSGVTAARRIFQVLEIVKPRQGEGETRRQGEPDRLVSLSFDDVHYAYADDRPALNGVSFALEAGQRVALVGPSGAGKSTWLNCYALCRATTRRDSREPGAAGGRAGLRLAQAGGVGIAESVPVHMSAMENIRLARPGATLTRLRWQRSLRTRTIFSRPCHKAMTPSSASAAQG